jgi:uncharacterized protein
MDLGGLPGHQKVTQYTRCYCFSGFVSLSPPLNDWTRLNWSSRAKRATKLSGWCRGINNLLRFSLLICVALVSDFVLAQAAPPAAPASEINWQRWDAATFESAQKQDKLIFVDVGIEGCTACRRMEQVTFRDPRVIGLLNEHFVAISLDAEARPDLGQRYSDWAWPALVFLLPDSAQVLALRGNRSPENFIAVLDELISSHAAGTLTRDASEPLLPDTASLPASLDAIRLQIRNQLDGQLNEKYGSWNRTSISATSSARYANLAFRAFMYDNAELSAISLRSAASFLDLLDPVWGGVFQAYRFPLSGAGGGVVPEKRLAEQAGALEVFADAYQRTGEVRFRNAINLVDRYLQETLASRHGTFFTSQRNRPDNLPPHISVERYWSLRTEHERRAFGIPPVDHSVYTDKNAYVISGYVAAFEATGEMNFLRVAMRTADVLLRDRLTEAGWIRQHSGNEQLQNDERIRPLEAVARPYLITQASMGRALLALYGATGDRRWLDAAQDLATAMTAVLEDRANGGFYAAAPDPSAVFPPQKPLEANAQAGRLLYDLSIYLKKPELAQRALRTMQAVALPDAVRREGKVTARAGTMLELFEAGYVEISVVGSSDDERAQALYAVAREQYQPRKLLHYEAPGRYPDRPEPAIYICNPDFCTTPILDPAEIAPQLSSFRAPAATPYP